MYKIDEELSPIVLFAYNRLDKLINTIEKLKANKLADRSDLFVFSDGSKNDMDFESVNSVRHYLKSISGFKTVKIIYRKSNIGLASNVIDGVSEIVDKYGKIIVLEDDILTSEDFLLYMNKALKKYSDDTRVMAVSGYVSPFNNRELPDCYFMQYFDCWGWATWKDRWEKYQKNPKELVAKTNLKEIRKINFYGSAPDMWNQVLDNYRGRNNTWAIFFHIMVCKYDGFVLFPKYSLCKNIGLDGTGTNCDSSKDFDTETIDHYDNIVFPNNVDSDYTAIKHFVIFNKKRIKFLDKLYFFALRLLFDNVIYRAILQ